MSIKKKYIIQVRDKGLVFTTKNGGILRSPFTLSIKKEDYGYWFNEIRGKSALNYTIKEINYEEQKNKKIIVPEKEIDSRIRNKSKIPTRKKKG